MEIRDNRIYPNKGEMVGNIPGGRLFEYRGGKYIKVDLKQFLMVTPRNFWLGWRRKWYPLLNGKTCALGVERGTFTIFRTTTEVKPLTRVWLEIPEDEE